MAQDHQMQGLGQPPPSSQLKEKSSIDSFDPRPATHLAGRVDPRISLMYQYL